MMQWIIVIFCFFLLLGAEGRQTQQVTDNTPTVPVATQLDSRWRALRRLIKDTWIRCRAIAAGEEVAI